MQSFGSSNGGQFSKKPYIKKGIFMKEVTISAKYRKLNFNNTLFNHLFTSQLDATAQIA
ncbi:hypothetical protein BD749_1185 [Pontibacter ramchanderi]|uniref:Uncharacterized protein n=1 Tax=Pontibacter ramchanderi TaxID=1179743 RepID=A0A2N3V3L9_9BACT|nr:hypothetical protein BD749_1185 [Pontibacter ramchanderi]